jgi:hypothetical protein
MPWPPQKGELLPRFREAEGIGKKLRDYLLVLDHEDGGPKANGFLRMLAIDASRADYLERQIRLGIADTPISEIRINKPGTVSCAVEFQIAGVGRYSHRRAWVTTAWRLDGPDARPRFVTAIPRGKRKKR